MSKLLTQLPQPKVSGLMQETPLLISNIIEQAEANHGQREIVSRLPEGYIHRSNYQTAAKRSRQLANALQKDFGVQEGDVISTLAFNHIYHFECYYGISGIGAILHTVNPRLFPEQLQYVINHAQDTILCVDYACVPILANLIKTHGVNCNRVIVLTSSQYYSQCQQQLVEAAKSRSGYQLQISCYEEVLQRHSTLFKWPVLHENTASSLCYTSGTTGNPKGVLYSHRSTVLHSMTSCMADAMAVASTDAILLIVPMFHVNAWGISYTGAIAGAKLILPGAALDGKSLTELVEAEHATTMLDVPTVFLGMFQHWDANGITKLPTLESVSVGGSAAPEAMIRRFRSMNINVFHAWGMTELSPMGSTGKLLPKHAKLSEDETVKVLLKQGRTIYNIDKRIVDENGKVLPRDGKAAGELQVRGPWVTRAYFRVDKNNKPVESGQEDPNVDAENWFSTGDVSTLDQDGYMQITDRSKDVIKSGGEWISSIDLENVVVGHPAVAEACVVGHKHTKWQERPLLVIVKKVGKDVTPQEILAYLKPKIISWWMPNGVEFVTELPHTATGKLSKLTVRQQFKDYLFPDDPEHPNNKNRSKL